MFFFYFSFYGLTKNHVEIIIKKISIVFVFFSLLYTHCTNYHSNSKTYACQKYRQKNLILFHYTRIIYIVIAVNRCNLRLQYKVSQVFPHRFIQFVRYQHLTSVFNHYSSLLNLRGVSGAARHLSQQLITVLIFSVLLAKVIS